MQRFEIEVETEASVHVVDLGPHLSGPLRNIRGSGVAMLFVQGSTAALATLEHEPGLTKHDLPAMLQRLIPDDLRYQHEATWNDDNGHSHLRAMLLGPSLSIPFADGRLLTGEFQQVVLIELDTRPRQRKVIVSIVT